MSSYRIVRKDTDKIHLDSKDYQTIWIAHITKPDGTAINYSEVSVGDYVTLDRNSFKLVPQGITELCNFSEMLNEHTMHLSSYYKYYRKCPSGTSNFNLCFAYKIVEYSYLWQNLKVLHRLSQSMMQYPKSLVDYFIQDIKTSSFSKSFQMLTSCIPHFEYLGNEILEIYNKNLKICLQSLNISLKVLSYPNLTQYYLNNSGTIEFVFLEFQGNYFILYTDEEVALINSTADIKILQNFYETEHNMPAMVNDKKQQLSELGKMNQVMVKLIFDQIKLNIDNLKINPGLYQAIAYLKKNGENATVLEDALKSKFCCICKQPKRDTIQINCSHIYCISCIQYLISNDTNGKIVLNEEECKTSARAKCRAPNCNKVIGENVLKQIYSNFDELKRNSELRNRYTCCNCKTENSVGQMLVSCRHMCNICALLYMKCEHFNCLECAKAFSAEDRNNLNDIESECYGCRKNFNVFKGIIESPCGHNYCMRCFDESGSACLQSGKKIDLDARLVKGVSRVCSKCEKSYDSLKSIDLKRSCLCKICDECFCLDASNESSMASCASCSAPYSDKCQSYLKNEFLACEICLRIQPKSEFITLNPCTHSFCRECFTSNVNTHFKEKNIEDIIRCMNCKIDINPNQYDSIFEKAINNEIVAFKLEGNVNTIQCYNCKHSFQVIEKLRKQRCNNCGYHTCEVCKNAFHEEEYDCWGKYIDERLVDLEQLEDENGVTQCPGCRTPYLKNSGCDHVECIIKKCRVSFCFSCSCLRSPYLAHGTHYHRPSCRFFNKEFDEVSYEYNCEACRKLGSACPRPKDLKKPRRIGPDEMETALNRTQL